MKKAKKIGKVILILLGVLLLAGSLFVFIRWDWLQETVPTSGYSEEERVRKQGEELDTIAPNGEKFWVEDGEWRVRGGGFNRLQDGVQYAYNIDADIQMGAFRVVVYEIGKKWPDGVVFSTQLDHTHKVFDQLIDESGQYHIDFDMLENDVIYSIGFLEKLDGNNEFTYKVTDETYCKRWQYLYDEYIGFYLGTRYDASFSHLR